MGIDAKNIKSILGSVGIEAEDDKVALVVKELAGKSIEELIAEGSTKLASMPAGGGGGAAAPAAGGAAAAADAPAAKEEKVWKKANFPRPVKIWLLLKRIMRKLEWTPLKEWMKAKSTRMTVRKQRHATGARMNKQAKQKCTTRLPDFTKDFTNIFRSSFIRPLIIM